MRYKSVLTAALTATALLAAPAVATAAPQERSTAGTASMSSAAVDPVVFRLSGKDRIGTAVAISQDAWEAKGKEYAPSAVVLARSDSYADSLAAAPLASVADGPLLLTAPKSVPAATLTELRRVLPKGGQVYVLGGTGAISKSVADTLAKEFKVTRLGGANRFATAVSIAKKVDELTTGSGVGAYALTTGMNFPDGLAAGASAGTFGVPVLLTNDGRLPAETRDFLNARTKADPETVTVAVGGQAAAAGDWDWKLVGKDRYQTAADVARFFFRPEDGPDVAWMVGLATGTDWPDALAGSAYMAAYNGPLLLAQQNSLTSPSAGGVASMNARSELGVEVGVVFGGEGVLSKKVFTQFEAAVNKK